MRFKKFAAIILMSTMIGTMSLSGCGGVNKDAVAITMTSDDKDTELFFQAPRRFLGYPEADQSCFLQKSDCFSTCLVHSNVLRWS